MATVKVILRTSKLNLKGESPLYLRIIKDRRAKFISLRIYMHPNFWDEEKSRVRKSFPNSQRVNNYIAQKVADAEGVALELETKSKFVAPQKIKETIMGKSSESFLKYAERYLRELEHNGQIATLNSSESVISKVKDYWGNRDLLFDDITVNWLKTYESYLRTELNNSTNTVSSNLKVVRRLVNAAIAEEVYPAEKNPFPRFKLKWQQVEKNFLTEEELMRIQLLPLEKNSMKDHHRNMYVFAAYTGGLRISDLLQLRWKNFDGQKIHVHTQKTDTTVTIKIPNKALEILEGYMSETTKPSDFIFPIFKNDSDYSDPRKLFRAISSATAYTNTDLKDIAKAAGIEKKLHTHTSRHTWATRALYKGIRIEYVSKLMGHKSIKTTQVYAKIVNAELDKAMEVFN